MDEKRLEQFFENFGVAFWTLYLLFPFFLKRAMPVPLYGLVYLLLLGGYMAAMYFVYETFATRREFIIDSVSLVFGLIMLNWFVFFGSVQSTALDLTIYSVLSFSFAPTALRLESHKRGMAA